MIGLEIFDNLISLITYFKDNETCKQFLKEQRWGDDVVCPYCGHHHCNARSGGRFRCPNCLNNFSVLVGTIFENTKIALVKWFSAMYLISSHKKGISSHQLARDINVTQKTAWHILHKVRSLYSQDDSIELSKEVECDEAYIGGNEKNKHESKKTEGTQGRSLKTKTPVFGMAQRNGNIVAMKTQDTKGRTLMPIIRQFVKDGSRIITFDSVSKIPFPCIGHKQAVPSGNRRLSFQQAILYLINGIKCIIYICMQHLLTICMFVLFCHIMIELFYVH